MKLDALKALREGDAVMCRAAHGVALGKVYRADARRVVIVWADGSESVLVLAHVADGRDNRNQIIFPAPATSRRLAA